MHHARWIHALLLVNIALNAGVALAVPEGQVAESPFDRPSLSGPAVGPVETRDAYVIIESMRGSPPKYPIALLSREITGELMLRIQVSENGQPTEVTVATSSGHPELDDAAKDVAGKWVYVPAQQKGKRVAGVAMVPVRFSFAD